MKAETLSPKEYCTEPDESNLPYILPLEHAI